MQHTCRHGDVRQVLRHGQAGSAVGGEPRMGLQSLQRLTRQRGLRFKDTEDFQGQGQILKRVDSEVHEHMFNIGDGAGDAEEGRID